MTAKKPTKTGKILKGGGYFSGWPEYIPLIQDKLRLLKFPTKDGLRDIAGLHDGHDVHPRPQHQVEPDSPENVKKCVNMVLKRMQHIWVA